MFRKICFLIAFCLSIATIYAQSSSGGSNTAYAFSRADGSYGIMSFSLDNYSSFLMRHSMSDDVRAAAFVEGSYYALLYVDGSPAEIVAYDLATGEKETVVSTTGNFVDMAYDYSTQSVLLLQYDYPSSMLVRLNLNTQEFTTLCTFDYTMFAVAADMSGKIYVADMNGEIYNVDNESYELSSVANTEHYANSSALRSLDFDFNTGKLYFLANGSWSGSSLYRIDVEAGTSETVGMQDVAYIGLYTGYTAAAPESPAAPTGLTMTPAADGSNSCELSWTCPSTSFNRGSIGTLAQATIYRDGEVIATVDDVTAGRAATYTDATVTAGMHTYKVTLSNDAGEGMFALVEGYVGKDVPAAPTNVVATAEGSTITITWTAPTEGLNGGYMTADDITYKVVRSDEKVVAEAAAETSVSDVIEGTYAGYTYTVTACNSAGEGGSAVSNAAAAGEALTFPVVTGFNAVEDMNLWTVVDANADGNTWHMGSLWGSKLGAEFRRNPVSTGGADEWLISPPAKLTAGVQTLVTFDVRCSYSPTENIEVRLAVAGTAPEDAQLIETVAIKGSDAYYGRGNVSVNIPAVEADGEYRIYLRYNVAAAYSSNEGVHINDFVWKENNKATVSGTVRYGNSMMQFPCMGATVRMGDYTTTTDYSGKYTFADVDAGEYDIVAEYITGYSQGTAHVVLEAGDNITQDFVLTMLTRYTVSGTVTDETGAPVCGARVAFSGYDDDVVTTGEDGTYSAQMYEGDYTITVRKNNYVSQSIDASLDENMSGTDFTLEIDVLPSYGIVATDGATDVELQWEAPMSLTEYAYDNGEATDAYGYGTNGSESHIVGTIFVGENTLYELKWQTVDGDGCDDTVNLLVLGIDYGGNPTGEVLFQANAVPTVHGEWNTYKLPEPLHREQGFLFAISGKTYVATDGGTEDGTIDHPGTQTFTTNYAAPSSYGYIDELSTNPSRHLLLRILCQEDEADNATKPAMAYDLFRLPSSAKEDETQWTQLLTGSDALSYTDTNVPSGEYLYAVKTVYTGIDETSSAVFSEVVAHNMIADLTVSVSANSDPAHANGAKVTIYNDENNYTATVADGKAEFTNIEKGVYSMSVRHNGFEPIEEEGSLSITGEEVQFCIERELTQRLDQPINLDVLVDGSQARLLWNMQPNIVDNFDGDDYIDFEVNPAGNAGWQYIDADGMITFGFGSTTFPHMGERMAAITFNSKETTPPLGYDEDFTTAYSGTRALAFFAAKPIEAGDIVESDDYFISPELNPYRDFKFSFMARTYEKHEGNNERIRVGYSTTTPDLESFVWLDEEFQYVPLEYTKYEYDIPQEAKYVVLNSSSLMNFILFVDDVFVGVEGQVIGNSYMPVNVEGYEVYLDDAKVADTGDTEYTFSGLASGQHKASIVQKFATGNSEPLDITFMISTTGVDGIESDDVLSIYSVDDVLYINGEYSHAVVYNASGAQAFSLSGEHQADLSALPRGIYIVKAVRADGSAVSAKIIR